jgi:hypothetical protein
VAIFRSTVVAAPVSLILVGAIVLEAALSRRLTLADLIGTALDRQIVLTLLLALLIQPLLLLLLFLALLLLAILLILLLLALLLLTFLLAALLIKALLILLLLLTLLLIHLLLPLLLLALLELLLLTLLQLLLLLLLMRTVGIVAAGVPRIIIIGQNLSADAQRQQADARQTPDTRTHAFLTVAQIPVDRTAFWVRRSRHSISERAPTELEARVRSGSSAICRSALARDLRRVRHS